MSSPNHLTFGIEDAFSSNFPDFISASLDYVPASPGKTYSSSSNNSFGLVPIASPTLSLFHGNSLFGLCMGLSKPRVLGFSALLLKLHELVFSIRIITSLHSEFAMTDLGSVNYFLGISVLRSVSGLFLYQLKFAEEILERAHMQNCNPCRTPVDTESKLSLDGDPVSDPTLYRSHAGTLQYLTFTRRDLSYVVQQVCLYMHDPRDLCFSALKRILCYVCGTLDYGLQLHVSSTTQLSAYTDTDWVGCPVTRRSTSGY
ncbi:ribonuclease H-like domain-containing protein, partial [Tanacetum coccineum]